MAFVKPPKLLTRIGSALHTAVYTLSRGRLGATYGRARVVLLTTTGRKSGRERTRPLFAIPHGDGWALIASYGGHDEHPAWYLNLQADPNATITVDNQPSPVRARTVAGDERAQLWARFVEIYRDYEDYQQATDREIPVVALEPVVSSAGS